MEAFTAVIFANEWRYLFYLAVPIATMLSVMSRDTILRRVGFLIFLSWAVYLTTYRLSWGIYVYGALDVLLGLQIGLWWYVCVGRQYRRSLGWIASIFGLMFVGNTYSSLIDIPFRIVGLSLNLLFLMQLALLGRISLQSYKEVPAGEVRQPPEVGAKWTMIDWLTKWPVTNSR